MTFVDKESLGDRNMSQGLLGGRNIPFEGNVCWYRNIVSERLLSLQGFAGKHVAVKDCHVENLSLATLSGHLVSPGRRILCPR